VFQTRTGSSDVLNERERAPIDHGTRQLNRRAPGVLPIADEAADRALRLRIVQLRVGNPAHNAVAVREVAHFAAEELLGDLSLPLSRESPLVVLM
jgi:hypothetical protein